MAAALLQRDALDSPSQTNLGAKPRAQEGRRFTLDDGEIRATIRDGHACFNLNAINHRTDEAGDGTPYPTDVFVRLLALLGEPRRCAPARSPPPLATGRTATASRG